MYMYVSYNYSLCRHCRTQRLCCYCGCSIRSSSAIKYEFSKGNFFVRSLFSANMSYVLNSYLLTYLLTSSTFLVPKSVPASPP